MVLNPGKNCNTQPKTKDKELRATSLKESRVSSAQSSVKFQCALNFCLAILKNQRQEKAIEALSKKSNGMEIEAGRLSSCSGHNEEKLA